MSDNIMEHDLLLGGGGSGWQGGRRHRSYFDASDDNPLIPRFISVERISRFMIV